MINLEMLKNPIVKERVLASKGKRVGGYILDSIFIAIITSIINLFKTKGNAPVVDANNDFVKFVKETAEYNLKLEKDNLNIALIVLAVGILYYVVFNYLLNGQTLGKLILNTRIVRLENLEKANFLQILLRNSISILFSVLPIIIVASLTVSEENGILYMGLNTFLMILSGILTLASLILIFNSMDQRTIEDRIAKTIVVNGDINKETYEQIYMQVSNENAGTSSQENRYYNTYSNDGNIKKQDNSIYDKNGNLKDNNFY